MPIKIPAVNYVDPLGEYEDNTGEISIDVYKDRIFLNQEDEIFQTINPGPFSVTIEIQHEQIIKLYELLTEYMKVHGI